MDGWMDVWMDGWINGWINGWMDGWMNEWMDGWMDGWMDRWIDGWMLLLNTQTHPPKQIHQATHAGKEAVGLHSNKRFLFQGWQISRLHAVYSFLTTYAL